VPSEKEIETIIELYNNGKSQREIAEEIGKSQPTINNRIKDLIRRGLIKETDQSKTKKAVEAHKFRLVSARISIHERAVKKADGMLDAITKPSELRDWSIAWGTILDKYRLEDPPAGNNGVAAIDYYMEKMKREATEDESEAKT
jgi:DNA-binding Lrp family transcriptional regulator